MQRARDLCAVVGQPLPQQADLFGANTLQAFIIRTERVADTARRRVINGESVPNGDKLFSRQWRFTGTAVPRAMDRFMQRKAWFAILRIRTAHSALQTWQSGAPIQFGRQVLVYEDASGFLVRTVLMKRDEGDKDVAVRETKAMQKVFHDGVKRLSFDRGFHSPENQTQLSDLVDTLRLPKPGAKQSVVQQSEADEEFLAAQQNHSGVESAIGALQSGNALKRCRDRSEVGFERYLQLAILGRNLHTLGRLLIARDHENAAAGHSRHQAA